jgi:lysophospholipase L1-like esterase
MRDVRVCVFGDALVAGVGDPKALGWVGRVAARTPPSTGIALTAYPLGVRGEAIEDVVVRMPLESASRFARGDEHRVVLAAGVVDAERDVRPARAAAALDFGLAATGVPCLVIGPPPMGDDALRARLAQLDAAYALICERIGVDYISTFERLDGRKPWHDARTDEGHPNQTGYGLLTRVILDGGWYDWLGVKPPSLKA